MGRFYKPRPLWNSPASRVSGEMADARALGARGAIRAGSSPVSPTILLFLLRVLLDFCGRLFQIPILDERSFVLGVEIELVSLFG